MRWFFAPVNPGAFHMSDSTQATKPLKSKATYTYQIGDRVAERPISRPSITNNQELVNKYRRQRIGTVVGHRYKVNKRGSRERFLYIQWDHLSQPCEHAQHRICPLDKLKELTNSAYHAIG